MTEIQKFRGQPVQVDPETGCEFVELYVPQLREGYQLDQGIFVEFEAAQGSDNWYVALAGGAAYIESRDAKVRVWL